MRVILDTNVFVSGVFFSGPPFQILQAWRDRKVQLVVSPEIIEEYQRVAEVISAPPMPEQVCVDPDDDKFLACALASRTPVIVSGDNHLLKVDGYSGIRVMKPRRFRDEFAGLFS